MKRSPPLKFVRSFESAARHLSFTAAAEELNLTQAAVSGHVRDLEEQIGRPLFQRFSRSLSLTEVGEAYLPSIRDALKQIDLATESIANTPSNNSISIACPASLAESWLSKKIYLYRQVKPEIDISIHATIWADVGEQVADIRIVLDRTDDSDNRSELKIDKRLALACSPDYWRENQIHSPGDLKSSQLIHILGRQEFWQLYAAEHGIEELDLSSGVKTDSSNIALELATQGLGYSLTLGVLVDKFVDNGSLIEPFSREIESPWGYSILHNESLSEKVRHLKSFLLQ